MDEGDIGRCNFRGPRYVEDVLTVSRRGNSPSCWCSDIPVSDVHLRNKVWADDDVIDTIPSTFSSTPRTVPYCADQVQRNSQCKMKQ